MASGSRHRRSVVRRLGSALVTLLIAIPFFLVLVWLYLLLSLPSTEGELSLSVLDGPVLVDRDENGIPTIIAGSDADAYRALGYVHAQDRLFQMDLMRRVGQGRMSEVAGSATLKFDKLMRAFDFYRLAEQQVRALAPQDLSVLEAYAEGVNAFLAKPGGALPIEYLPLLAPEPEPWTPADSVVWAKIMALQLSGNWRDEMARAKLQTRLTPEQIADLWSGPANLASATLAAIPDLLSPPGASNAWVIDGARTKSGKPILANDPHLMFQAPIIWYLARIETPTLTLAGATTPGVPMMVIGHNGRVAWGFTTTHSDTQDLFIETVDANDPTQYLAPDGPRPFSLRTETIAVRFGDPVEMVVRSTRNGVVISDFMEEAANIAPPRSVIALAWPALHENDPAPSLFLHLNRAGSADEARRLLQGVGAPQQNIFLADTGGDIGFIAPAWIPIRKDGDGRSPVPGAEGRFDWTGFIPPEDLPQAMNPEKGYFANGNNRIVTDDYPYLITKDWEAPYRGQRLDTLVAAAETHTVEDSIRIAMDVVSPAAQALLPLMLNFTPETRDQAEAHAILARWDGNMDPERPEPAIFTAWLRALTRGLYGDEVGDLLTDIWDWHPGFIQTVLTEKPVWCDDVRTTDTVEPCALILRDTLSEALDLLRDRLGSDMVAWQWGKIHLARFPHPILGRIPLIGPLFTLSVPTGGDNFTINRGTPRIERESRLFDHVHGASLRAVFDLSDLNNSRFMIPTGQSGNPLSPHFGDLLHRWSIGDFVTLPSAKQRADADLAVRRLLLKPMASE